MAQGSIDRLYATISKAKAAVQKAQESVLSVSEILVEAISEADIIGGKIKELVPSHLDADIDKLTKIDQDLSAVIESDQSSLAKLEELIGNIPYRDIKPASASEHLESRKQMVNIRAPDLSQGPQSQLSKQNESIDLSDVYNSYRTNFDNQKVGSFSFDQIRESKIFGEEIDEDMMAFAKTERASLGKYIKQGQQKIRETINRADLEDRGDNEGERLVENFKALSFRSPGIDDTPFGAIFNADLAQPGHVVS